MKRSTILFIISLLTTIAISSQDIYPKKLNDSLVVITADQLKQTNLIFLEHSHLIQENDILSEKLDLQDELIFNYQQMDSINRTNLIKLNKELDFSKSEVVRLNKKVNTQRTILWVGSSALVAAIVAFLLK